MKKILSLLKIPSSLLLLLFLGQTGLFGQTASATGVVGPASPESLKGGAERPRISGNLTRGNGSVIRRTSAGRGITTSEGLEKRVFDLINDRRKAKGLKPLVWNPSVAGVARSHSKEMALYDYFSHTDVDGYLVDNRAIRAGMNDWTAIGENIAYLRGFDDPAENAVERWMQSPSHRDNLLDSRWRETGIGLAIASDGTYFFTQVFMVE